MDPHLQELLDERDIRNLLSVYCQGTDRLDAERMVSVFARDSWVDHGDDHGAGEHFVNHILPVQAEQTSMVQHLMGQSLVQLNGDEAAAESYFLCVLRGAGEEGAKFLIFMGGRYLDNFRREDGAWKIAKRVCVKDWSYGQPVENDPLAWANFLPGSWSQADPMYAALGLKHSGKMQLEPA
jgi:hypothetical protein